MNQALPPVRSADELLGERESLRQEGRRLVLTNGCFDLIHPGHLYYLERAAALGDALWIGLNADESVRALKGPSRPVQNEQERAYTLTRLAFVHQVFVFREPRLTREIKLLGPEIYTKAGDYTLETLNQEERRALEELGARIEFIPFLPGYSSTALIERIARAAPTF